jgi:aminoglycoside phosphotransferase (APT) family kinase protein
MPHPWEAEVALDETRVRALVGGAVPELQGASVVRVGEGWDNTAWRVGERWLFRFPRRQAVADLVPGEVALLGVLAGRLPLPVPRPVHVCPARDGFPWPFVGYTHVPGREALGRVHPDDVGLAEQIGVFLRALHDTAPPMGVPVDTLGRLDVARMRGRLEARRALLGDLLVPAVEARLSAAETVPPDGVVLCHGDLYGRHVLVDAGGASGVIDWGDAHLGEPAVDLSIAWSLFGPEAREALLAVYGIVGPGTRIRAAARATFHSLALLAYARDTGRTSLAAATEACVHRALHET